MHRVYCAGQALRPILVLDRDPMAREALLRILHEHHLPARAMADLAELAAARDRGDADLVVIDAQSLGADGRVDGFRITPNGPAVIVVGCASCAEAVAALECGAADVMRSPVNPRELLARIRAVRRRLDRQASLHPPLERGSPPG